jgi:hypothetical protein
LFTAVGKSKALINSELVGPAMVAEDMFAATCLTPQTGVTMRRLAELAPATLALMHVPSYAGDGGTQLRGLADAYDERLRIEGQPAPASGTTSRSIQDHLTAPTTSYRPTRCYVA